MATKAEDPRVTPEPTSGGPDLRGQLTQAQMVDLAAPLDPQYVAGRELRGKNLSYIEGHHAIREANRIFGFSAWSRTTLEMRLVIERPYKSSTGKEGFLVAYVASVRVTVRNVDGTQTSNDGFGYGEGIDYLNPGQAHESAVKEAETDAMKRAMICFGDPFGLALYDKKQAHVEGNGHDAAPAARPAQASPARTAPAQAPAAGMDLSPAQRIVAFCQDHQITTEQRREIGQAAHLKGKPSELTQADAAAFEQEARKFLGEDAPAASAPQPEEEPTHA
jgi:DNA repair and recombination protein RAD52